MAIVSVPLAGQYGLSVDTAPAELVPNAWSSGLNARFSAGAVEAMRGDVVVASLTGTPTALFQAAVPLGLPGVWAFTVGDQVLALQQGTVTDITPVGATPVPTYPELNPWSGGVMSGYTMLNDGQREPFGWVEADPLTPMVNLPDWPAGTRAYTLRTFRQYGVALGIKRGGDSFPTMVKWSHPADPGNAPGSWDETDPTLDAGEAVLAETPGQCVDCVPMRDVNIIYKTDSVWGMQYIGGVFVFRFYKIFGDFGIPNRNCAVEYLSGRHFVYTGTDLIVHDGTTAQSVVTGKMKKFLANLSIEAVQSAFVFPNPAENEVWFCWRDTAVTGVGATKALVYNYRDSTVALRELDGFSCMQSGRVEVGAPADNSWTGKISSWDGTPGDWGTTEIIPSYTRILAGKPNALVWVEGASTQHNSPFVERTYIGIPVRTDKAPDMSAMKFVRRIWPRFLGEDGTRLLLTFGTADSVSEPINWRPPQEYILGTTRKLDLTLSGKVFAVRISCPATSPLNAKPWKFNGFDLDVTPTGEM